MALSRARLGLYILGRASVFESCFELKPAFDILLSRPTQLSLVTDEMFERGFSRGIDDEVEEGREAVMQGVEHLGQYVFEMTKAKVEALKAGGGEMPGAVVEGNGVVAGEDEDDADREEDVVVADEVADVDIDEDQE